MGEYRGIPSAGHGEEEEFASIPALRNVGFVGRNLRRESTGALVYLGAARTIRCTAAVIRELQAAAPLDQHRAARAILTLADSVRIAKSASHGVHAAMPVWQTILCGVALFFHDPGNPQAPRLFEIYHFGFLDDIDPPDGGQGPIGGPDRSKCIPRIGRADSGVQLPLVAHACRALSSYPVQIELTGWVRAVVARAILNLYGDPSTRPMHVGRYAVTILRQGVVTRDLQQLKTMLLPLPVFVVGSEGRILRRTAESFCPWLPTTLRDEATLQFERDRESMCIEIRLLPGDGGGWSGSVRIHQPRSSNLVLSLDLGTAVSASAEGDVPPLPATIDLVAMVKRIEG